MKWFSELRRRLGFRGETFDADLAEEMRLHLELRAEEQRELGADPAAAQAVARRKFGNVTRIQESSRDAWGWSAIENLLQDLRYGLRTLAANPGFTATAVLSLALGIGANTAIFGIINAVMLRTLPIEDPQRIVRIEAGNRSYFTNPIWEQIRDHQGLLAGTLAYGPDRFDLANGGETRHAEGMWVSGDFFRVLGVSALLGRVLTTADDRHGCGPAGPIAVISHAFWQRNYGGDSGVLGKTVSLNRHKFEIVGVTPPWFTGMNVDRGYDVAIPIGCEPVLHTDQSALEHRSWWWLTILGRLAPGTTAEQAEAQLRAAAPEIYKATLPKDWDDQGKSDYLKRTLQLNAAPGFSNAGGQYRIALFTLMAIVGLVLLVACANVANLLLARASARQREISVRMAIGAKRGRIVRQLLTESLLLALLGAAGGLVFAIWGSGILVRLLSTSNNRLEISLTPDLRVLAFTAGVSLLTALLFGLIPALRVTRLGPHHVMKENAPGAIGGTRRLTLTRILLAGQIALSLVLVVGAGLFLATLRNLLTLDAGFDRSNVLLVQASVEQSAVPKERRLQTFEKILDRLKTVPGVVSASSSSLTPISNMEWNQWTYPEGPNPPTRDESLVYLNRVSPGYFRTMGTPLLLGRDFTDRDRAGSPRVIIIAESTARHFFGSANSLGKTIGLDTEPGGKPMPHQVVGVVKDARYTRLDEKPVRSAYLAMGQEPNPEPSMRYEVRSASRVDALLPSVRAAIAAANPDVSLEFRTFEQQVGESLLQQRLVAVLSSVFGALALVLAMVGLYGTTAYTVARRQSEIGIRMALGAQQGSVVWLVLRDFVRLIGAGLAIGLATSAAASRLVASLLYGIGPTAAGPLILATLILVLATLWAAWIPARRAATLDPMTALREE